MNETVHNLWASELIEDVPLGVVLFDNEGRASWVNRFMLTMLGADSMESFLACQDDDESKWKEIFSQQASMLVQRTDGTDLHLECTFKDYQGSRQGRAGFYVDVGESYQLNQRVERLTMNDPLTAMLNWRGIMRELDTLVSRSRRYENSLSVIHVRIGTSDDDAILAASRCLREQTRWTDMVGRYNDDGFMVILPETTETDTSVLIDKIKQALDSVHEKAGFEEALKVEVAAVQWQKGEDTRLLLERLESQLGTANAA